MYEKHGHFADVVVADALYLNAPFINTVLKCHMDEVIRLKDEKRLVFKDAQGLFEMGEGRQKDFTCDGLRLEVWDVKGFEMEGVDCPVRVVKVREYEKIKSGKKKGEERKRGELYLVTTNEEIGYQTLWKMMHRRWDIEENAFHQLKTYYHGKHCYDHKAVEVIFEIMILSFNIRELYLYRRMKGFRESKITRKSVTLKWRDDLQKEKMVKILYQTDG